MGHFVLTLLCITLLWAFSNATIEMTKTSTWRGSDGLMKTHAFCTFNITQRQRTGAWKMSINTNIPTKYIKMWIMEVTERLNDGQTYKVKSIHEYWPQTIDVQFRLSYQKGTVPINGSCSSNVEPEEPTPATTDNTKIEASTNIFQVHTWTDNGLMVMQGQCILPVTKEMENYFIAVTFDHDTFDIVNWKAKQYSKDPNGRWYILKNKWTTHPPELTFNFQVKYDSANPPTGACTILTGTNPNPPATQPPTTPSIPTADTTTADVVETGSYQDNDKMKLQAKCYLPIDTKLENFYILIELTEDTSDLEIWIVREHFTDSNGRLYLVKNSHDAYPPAIEFAFNVRYDSGAKPSGVCKLYNEDLEPIILKPTTPPPTTTQQTTQKQTTRQVTTQQTTQRQTTPPTTTQQTTQKQTTPPTTTQQTTQKQTTPPTTTQQTTQKQTTPSTTSQQATTQKTTSTSNPTTKSHTTTSTAVQPETTKMTSQSTLESTSSATTTTQALSTKYDYAEVMRLSIMFYEAQRSGELPADNRILYRGDSALGDKGFNGEDLTGGWYDAGDNVKFNFPMAASATVLSWGLHQWQDAYLAAGQLEFMYNSIKWPLDYFLKCWRENQLLYYCQVGDGHLDHAFWGRPEEMTMNRPPFAVSTSSPGSDVAGETAAALAAGSMAFASKDPVYSSELLSKAKTLYAFAKTFKGKYSDSVPEVKDFYNSYSGYGDELCLSAAMLYKATKDNSYLSDAEGFATTSTSWSFSWDEKAVACQLILFQETGKSQYKTPVEHFISDYMGNGVKQTDCGLAWRSEWGANRYAANAAFIALMAADTPGFDDAEQYKTWAMSQIHYMLGENKYGISYQIGFGNYYPKKPHHGSSSCPDQPSTCNFDQLHSSSDNPQILYGALVGGPDDQDNYIDDRTDYIKNEVACDYNAGFQSAAAGLLHFALEGKLPAAPTPKC